jgi:hypothetical protein
LKELLIVRLKSLSTFELSQAAELIELGCTRASTTGSLLQQVDVAETH